MAIVQVMVVHFHINSVKMKNLCNYEDILTFHIIFFSIIFSNNLISQYRKFSISHLLIYFHHKGNIQIIYYHLGSFKYYKLMNKGEIDT
jgi:hypothetical protein